MTGKSSKHDNESRWNNKTKGIVLIAITLLALCWRLIDGRGLLELSIDFYLLTMPMLVWGVILIKKKH